MTRTLALLGLFALAACDDGDDATPADAGPLQDLAVLQDSAVTTDSAVEADSTPVEADAAPADEDATPVELDAAPVDEDAAPAEEDAAPVEEDAAPIEEDAGPVEPDAAPIEPGEHLGELSVDCAVPYVLDASRVGDAGYMTAHFEHLIQQYCVTGALTGVDLNGHPEKMFYGTHAADGTVSLQQVSMSAFLTPTFSVRIDFAPDSAISTGDPWAVSAGAGARVMIIEHADLTSTCLRGVGVGGALEFSEAADLLSVEGGRFTVTGAVTVARATPEICAEAQGLECCD